MTNIPRAYLRARQIIHEYMIILLIYSSLSCYNIGIIMAIKNFIYFFTTLENPLESLRFSACESLPGGINNKVDT